MKISHGELVQLETAAENRAKTGVETPENLLGIETRTEAQKGRSEAQRGVGEDHGAGPIRLDVENITQKMTDDMDEAIMKAVINCNIKVNKAQLIRALELDNKVRSGELVEVTRCRDCKFNSIKEGPTACDYFRMWFETNDGFCKWGKPRENKICPRCHLLYLKSGQCPACGWKEPRKAGEKDG